MTVAVVEGRVRISGAGAGEQSSSALVPAGSIAVTEPNTTLLTATALVSVQAEMAWRGGQLVFRNDTLAEAAAEFNRYNERKLVVTGEATQIKIGGSFKASNVEGFARLLRDVYGLNVEISNEEVRITGLRRKAATALFHRHQSPSLNLCQQQLGRHRGATYARRD